MPYKDEYHPKIKTDLKKLEKAVVKEIYDIHIDKILKEPHSSEKLLGTLSGFLSYHFKKNRVNYRIAYAIEENSKSNLFPYDRQGDNFCDLLKRRLS